MKQVNTVLLFPEEGGQMYWSGYVLSAFGPKSFIHLFVTIYSYIHYLSIQYLWNTYCMSCSILGAGETDIDIKDT